MLLERIIQGGVQHCLESLANDADMPLAFDYTGQGQVCALWAVVVLQRVWPILETIEEPRGERRTNPCCEVVKSS